MHTWIAVLTLASAPLSLPAQEVDHDVSRLSSRVLSAEPIVKEVPSALVVVEVRNDGENYVEPLAFRFTPRKDARSAVEVPRVGLPHYGRVGRPARAGEARLYELLVPLDAKAAKSADVEVTQASFPVDAASIDAPAEVRKTEVFTAVDPELGRSTTRTRIELRNHASTELDVVLRARFTEPFKAESLIEVRLPPASDHTVVIEELPTERGRGYHEAKIVALDIVDWCAIATRGEAEARALLTTALERWDRLPDDLPGLRGNYTCTFTNGGAVSEQSGRFEVTRAGAISLDPQATPAVVSAIRDALRDALRGPPSEVLADLDVEMFALGMGGRPDVVRLDRAPFLGMNSKSYLGIAGGRIVWSSGSRSALPRESWSHREVHGSRWVATDTVHRTAYQAKPQSTRRMRFELRDTLAIPIDFRTTWTLVDFPESDKITHVTFADVTVGAATGPNVPTGELADLLRDAWEATYRYPDEARTLRGAFVITTPGTDGVWLGHRKVQGTFRLEGFRGRRWQRAVVEVEGKKLSEETRAALANAVVDRFLLFAHRDFAGRSSFHQAFAGASLSGDGARIEIANAALALVEIRDGRPVALTTAGGLKRELDLTKLGRTYVARTISAGDETIEAAWTDLGGGWAYPKELTFKRVFGKDWGPERIKLTKLAIE